MGPPKGMPGELSYSRISRKHRRPGPRAPSPGAEPTATRACCLGERKHTGARTTRPPLRKQRPSADSGGNPNGELPQSFPKRKETVFGDGCGVLPGAGVREAAPRRSPPKAAMLRQDEATRRCSSSNKGLSQSRKLSGRLKYRMPRSTSYQTTPKCNSGLHRGWTPAKARSRPYLPKSPMSPTNLSRISLPAANR